MVEALAVLGLAKITESVFTPILQDIAKQAAIDLSSSYSGKAFDKVFSVIHKGTLAKATGLVRIKEDEDERPRSTALAVLAEHWRDDVEINELILKLAFTEGFAATLAGGKHSKLGGIIFTRDCDGFAPYLNPRTGLSDQHIKRAATSTGVQIEHLQSEVQNLSEYLGWDITKGSGR